MENLEKIITWINIDRTEYPLSFLASVIQSVRLDRNYTQVACARSLAVSGSYITKLESLTEEKSGPLPSYHFAKDMEKLFDLPEDSLVEMVDAARQFLKRSKPRRQPKAQHPAEELAFAGVPEPDFDALGILGAPRKRTKAKPGKQEVSAETEAQELHLTLDVLLAIPEARDLVKTYFQSMAVGFLKSRPTGT